MAHPNKLDMTAEIHLPLHPRRQGTITNTLAATCELGGTILAEPAPASDHDSGEASRR